MKKLLFSAKTTLILIVFIAMSAASCDKGNNHIKITVPLNAEFQVATTIISPGSPGVLEHARATGSGSGEPIGKATIGDDILVNVSVSPEIIQGVDTITTSNGDRIFSTYTGTSPGPDENLNFEVHNMATIRGGTGKFAGATGNFTYTVKGNFKNPTATSDYTGTITY